MRRQGAARHGMAWRGVDWRGMDRRGVQGGHGMAWRGGAGLGLAWRSAAVDFVKIIVLLIIFCVRYVFFLQVKCLDFRSLMMYFVILNIEKIEEQSEWEDNMPSKALN